MNRKRRLPSAGRHQSGGFLPDQIEMPRTDGVDHQLAGSSYPITDTQTFEILKILD
ncbi:MAG: hypothetical protein QNJ58_27035 [Desulfobacterales bacterium]|nr:hypothetical protein [Desulfobacterales bacterium]